MNKEVNSSSEAVRLNVCERHGHKIVFSSLSGGDALCSQCGMTLSEIRGKI